MLTGSPVILAANHICCIIFFFFGGGDWHKGLTLSRLLLRCKVCWGGCTPLVSRGIYSVASLERVMKDKRFFHTASGAARHLAVPCRAVPRRIRCERALRLITFTTALLLILLQRSATLFTPRAVCSRATKESVNVVVWSFLSLLGGVTASISAITGLFGCVTSWLFALIRGELRYDRQRRRWASQVGYCRTPPAL